VDITPEYFDRFAANAAKMEERQRTEAVPIAVEERRRVRSSQKWPRGCSITKTTLRRSHLGGWMRVNFRCGY